jgi:hypothetical protein
VSTRCHSRHAARRKVEIEMVGVQAGHETAHIVEWLAKCEGLDERKKCGALLRRQHASTAL